MPMKRLLALFGVLALVTLACGFTVDLGTSSSSTATSTPPSSGSSLNDGSANLERFTQEAALGHPRRTSTPTPTRDNH